MKKDNNFQIVKVHSHKSVAYKKKKTCMREYGKTRVLESFVQCHLCLYLSICLSIYLPIYLSIYPYTYTHGAFVNLGKNSRHYHNSNLDYKINNIGLPLMILKRQQLLQHFNFGFNIKITSTCYLSNLILVHYINTLNLTCP